MANEKIMNTRIQLKYDSYANWQKSTVVLKAGEIAIAYLPPRPDKEPEVNGLSSAVSSGLLTYIPGLNKQRQNL